MVQRSTVLSDTFKVVHTILNDNVQSVSTTGGTVTLDSNNGNYWYGAFPDIDIENKDAYPIGVIETPNTNEQKLGWQWTENGLVIEISVYAARAEHVPKFMEAALEALRDNLDHLHSAGLYNMEIDQSTSEMQVRGDVKIHRLTVPVRFTFGHDTAV